MGYNWNEPDAHALMARGCLLGDLGLVRAAVADGASLRCFRASEFMPFLNFWARRKRSNGRSNDINLDSPIEAACAGGHALIVSWLLQAGASPNGMSDLDGWPLRRACEAPSFECAKLLIEAGASTAHWLEPHSSRARLLKRWGLLQ